VVLAAVNRPSAPPVITGTSEADPQLPAFTAVAGILAAGRLPVLRSEALPEVATVARPVMLETA